MRDKFCLLSNPCSLFLTDNIKLDGIPTEIKSNLNICFTFFQVLIEINPVNIYKTQLPVFFYFLLFYITFNSTYHFLRLFRISFNIDLKKDFHHKFSFFWMDLPKLPTPSMLNS